MDPQPTTDDWPVVPPAPTPVRPGKLLPRPTPDVRLIPPLPGTAVPASQTVPAMLTPPRPRPRRPVPVRATGQDRVQTGASVVALRRAGVPRVVRSDDLVWQPRFAYGAAVATLVFYALITLPLWIVLYRQALAPNADAKDLLALVMMLLGGMLVAVATWIILVEMRGRVRMVDSLARGNELSAAPVPLATPRSPAALPAAALEPPALPGTALAPTASIAARVRARLNAAGASSSSERLLGSFSGVLRSYSQRGAQLGLLAVALVLFLGATVLSLN